MNHLLVTKERVYTNDIGALDLTERIFERMHLGKSVVIVDKPRAFLPVLRKRWLKKIRSLKKERSSTLNADKISRLESEINYMSYVKFTLRYPPDIYPGSVYVIDMDTAMYWPPRCSSLYLMCNTDISAKYLIAAHMPEKSLTTVFYEPK